MDPLSIATAAVGAAKILYQASSTIHQFIQDAKIVDSVLENLRLEFDSTARILEIIKTRFRNPVHLIHARSQDHQDFLDISLASIQECDDASSEVITKIEEIGQGSTSILSRSMRQVRYTRIRKDILRTHTRIRDQKQNLQLLVQMLDVLLAHQSTALLTEKVLPPLSSLQLLIDNASKSRTEIYIHPTIGSRSLTLATTHQDSTKEESHPSSPVEPTPDISKHNEQEQEHEPLSHEETQEVPFRGMPVGSTKDIPENSEQERELYASDILTIQAFQARGQSLLESQSYANAEKAFSNCLKTYEVIPVESLPSSSIVQAQLGLATALMHQEKWKQAKDLFTFLAQDEGSVRAKSLFHLAQMYLAEHDFDNAYTACLGARAEFQSVTERSRCTSLLVLIAQTNEDEPAAAIYAIRLQENESSLWVTLPFYRFTSKGHGLSVSAEREALTFIKSIDEDTTPQRPENALIHSSFTGQLDAVKLLVWQGAPLNQISTFYFANRPITALMAAAYKGHTRIMEILIQSGADPDIGCYGYENKPGYLKITDSALNFAIRSKSVSAVRAILEAMAPNDEAYRVAILSAIDYHAESVVEVLLAHENIRELIKRHPPRYSSGASALHVAIQNNAISMVRNLVAAGFKPSDEELIQAHKSGDKKMIQEVTGAMNKTKQ